MKAIYLVGSQTGSVLSAFLGMVTGARYNHISIALDEDLAKMYSFGRRNPYNPFRGGFVHEPLHGGTFARFPQTVAVVKRVPVTQEQYDCIAARLERMHRHRLDYRYNFLGLCLAGMMHRVYRPENRFYCSEFVRDVLLDARVIEAHQLPVIVTPEEILSGLKGQFVFQGLLQDYGCAAGD